MALAERDFSYVRDLVYGSAAIVIEPGKEYLVESRLAPIAKEEGFVDLSGLVAKLRSAPQNGLHRKVVDAMTTNETTFFRDLYPFDMLRTEILPRLIEARKSTQVLTIWCAACSTGQEPYSVAMLLREHFPLLSRWRVKIYATDYCGPVLEKAKAGVFGQLEVNRGLPAPMLIKYFERRGSDFHIKDEIKSLIDFRQLNLMDQWPAMGPVSVIFIRNVLIYFDVATKKRILSRAHDLLTPDGTLFLGGAETTLNLEDRFMPVRVARGVSFSRKP